MRKPLLTLSVLALLAGCSPAPAPTESGLPGGMSQCLKDTDCKGERICDSGVCRAPGEGPGGSETLDDGSGSVASAGSVQLFDVDDDRVMLNSGELEITGMMGDQELHFASRAIRPKAFLHELVRGVDIGDHQAVLVAEFSGGTACPAQYFFVEVGPQGAPTMSEAFGTCSDLPQVSVDGAAVVVSMPGNDGDKRWRYLGGKLTEG